MRTRRRERPEGRKDERQAARGGEEGARHRSGEGRSGRVRATRRRGGGSTREGAHAGDGAGVVTPRDIGETHVARGDPRTGSRRKGAQWEALLDNPSHFVHEKRGRGGGGERRKKGEWRSRPSQTHRQHETPVGDRPPEVRGLGTGRGVEELLERGRHRAHERRCRARFK